LMCVRTSPSARWTSYAVSACVVTFTRLCILSYSVPRKSVYKLVEQSLFTFACSVAETAMGTPIHAQDDRGSNYVKVVHEWVCQLQASYRSRCDVASVMLWRSLYRNETPCTRPVREVFSHFEYLENRPRGLDVTWQPVRGDLTVRP
jgi:hypothetical protein